MSTMLQADGSIALGDGQVIAADEFDEMFAQAEAGEFPGRAGATFSGTLPRPKPTAWLDEASEAKLVNVAKARRTTPSKLLRELISAL